MTAFNEDVVEQASIQWMKALGYAYAHGPDIAPGGIAEERPSYQDVILEGRFRSALKRLNPQLAPAALEQVVRQVVRSDTASLEENNHAFQKRLTQGVEVEFRKDGTIRGDRAWLLDFDDPAKNDWLVVNQFTVKGPGHTRRPDLVVFVNGLPLGVIELKDPQNPAATLIGAWNQLQTYKAQVPALFSANEVLVISDGTEAKVGSLTAPWERMAPWRTIDGTELAPSSIARLEVLLKGVFEKGRFLDYVRNFVLWETADGFVKKTAGYHQFHAARKAVAATVRASRPTGDKRIGVVWHTQGSGKSISMVFYAAKLIREPAMDNPTVVVVTDRNDLDGQLYEQFLAAKDLIPLPVQVETREELRERLRTSAGGIYFTTMQKWSLNEDEKKARKQFPVLSERRNIVVMADEAHRSQYGFATTVDRKTGHVKRGFARNLRDALPNASFIGFTGTPIEFEDKSTPAVFGDYVDTYTISQSVADNATKPIHYEARQAMIDLPSDKKPEVDEKFEEVTEGEEESSKHRLKSRWARLEAMVGTEERIGKIAADVVAHWERRLGIIDGKAMFVAMSRRIAVDLYEAIRKLRPEWHTDDDSSGVMKIVMTGSASDPEAYRPHIRSKSKLRAIEKRFKDPDDKLKLVIVRDMWLTGFDAPCAHTLYVDKPMKGHGLMQAIARVNRVFRDKPAGLIVDYIGLAEFLRKAVGKYGGDTGGGGGGGGGGEGPGVPVELALRVLRERYEIVRDMLHEFDYSGFFTTDPAARMTALAGAADFVCGLDADDPEKPEEGKKRFFRAMLALNKAAGIALHLEGARDMVDEIGFFQAVERNLKKYTTGGSGKSTEDLNTAIRQIVSSAVAAQGVVDIFDAAGLEQPDLSILSDEFLLVLRANPYKNLQVELLKKLINDELAKLRQRNVVQSKKFSKMLDEAVTAYKNRSVEVAAVIKQLIEMAKAMQSAAQEGERLGLTTDEKAFYDALADHGDVRSVMGDDALADIAHDLVRTIRNSVTVDWTQKEAVRAKLRTRVKRLLRKHGYPPDKREEAVVTVLEQAETLARDWADNPPEDARSPSARVLPFRRIGESEAEPFVNCLPLLDLKIAAGGFSADQVVEGVVGQVEWVAPSGRTKPARDLFVAQVIGESMNRRIPNGAWCVWRLDPGCDGQSGTEVVLAQHRDIQDPELGGKYTVKLYETEKEHLDDGTWRHKRITLRPSSSDARFQPIVFEDVEDGELEIVAELVEVLR